MEAIAVDVAKGELVVFDSKKVFPVPNKARDIDLLLDRHPGSAVVLEPTSTYHLELAERAHRRGHTVYLVNPRDAHHYAESCSFRASTDPIMAEVLYDFAQSRAHKLRPWRPLPEELRELKALVRRRFHLAHMRSKLAQVFEGCSDELLARAFTDLTELMERTEREAVALAKAIAPDRYERLDGTPGVGPFSASCFTFLLSAKEFDDRDAITAFVGLDTRVRDSGKRKGTRYVTKRGDRILRYAATCAGRGLLNSAHGRDVDKVLQAQGRKHAERLVIAGRKILRTILALEKKQTQFDPEKFRWRVDKNP